MVLVSVTGWVDPWAMVRPERIMSMKYSNDNIGNRTRDLPACSAVPKPTAPPQLTPFELPESRHMVNFEDTFLLMSYDAEIGYINNLGLRCLPRHCLRTNHRLWMLQRNQINDCDIRRRARAEPDGTRAETRFRLSPKRTSPFNSAGESVQSTAGSRGVRISVSNAGYTTSRGRVRVLATHSIRQFPLHFPSRASPCATTFRTQYTRQR